MSQSESHHGLRPDVRKSADGLKKMKMVPSSEVLDLEKQSLTLVACLFSDVDWFEYNSRENQSRFQSR